MGHGSEVATSKSLVTQTFFSAFNEKIPKCSHAFSSKLINHIPNFSSSPSRKVREKIRKKCYCKAFCLTSSAISTRVKLVILLLL